jgi:hypothetical protein
MKDKYIITTLGAMLFISVVIGIILFELCNDLVATANGYESDRNICRRELKEVKDEISERK